MRGEAPRSDRVIRAGEHARHVLDPVTVILSIWILRPREVVFPSDGGDPFEDLRPSFAHLLERKIVLRRAEAGMHQANPGAAVDLGERPRDDGIKKRAVPGISGMSASPSVDQAFVP